MKGSIYSSGMIPTVDDLDFTEQSKAVAIEQTRYDLMQQKTRTQGGGSTILKGVIKDSGLSAGHTADPLLVYITNTGGSTLIVNIWSGVAYDSFENRSRRIWVPDNPADVPLTSAAAVSNHDNIDVPEETLTRDFTTSSRPPRTSLKTFGAADAAGVWYTCIKYVEGKYDPITVPNDGSIADSKGYDSYEIRVSQNTAAALYGIDGDPWLPLASLNWDGSTVAIISDDRIYTSPSGSLSDDMIVQHQDRYHGSGIISEDASKLLCTIDTVGKRVVVASPAFTANEGMNINGVFVQTLLNTSVAFTVTDVTGYYYVYIDALGTMRKTSVLATAQTGLVLCAVYWDVATSDLRRGIAVFDYTPFDYRMFGTIGEIEIDKRIVGDNWNRFGQLTLDELNDELITHRYYAHGNGIYSSGTDIPYAGAAGSLGATIAATKVNVNSLNAGDVVYIHGWECNTIYGDSFVDFAGEVTGGTYLVYAQRVSSLYPNIHAYTLDYVLYTVPVDEADYPICTVTWNPGTSTLSVLVDKRVYNTVGYNHIQRNSNAQNRNSLPDLMVCMSGQVNIAANTVSNDIYLTDDWGPGNYGGGGTTSGKTVFPIKPIIRVYVNEPAAGLGWCNLLEGEDAVGVTVGYSILTITNNTFKIRNHWTLSAFDFYWVVIGPTFGNTLAAIQGRDNPTYDS